MTFSDHNKKKWREALHIKMSSEESAVEGDLEVIEVKPLPWRSEEANDVLRRLDDRILSDRSPQSRRQAKESIHLAVSQLTNFQLGSSINELGL